MRGKQRRRLLVRYRVNKPRVVAEAFADEVVIVNFEDGIYYSLGDSGHDIWAGIEAGASAAEVVQALVERYGADPADVEPAVSGVIQQLIDEGLIVERADDGAGPPAGWLAEGDGARSFAPPVLTRYSDMQELLLLDPIHEVDETGWPQRRPA
jgi:hypothetical protein